MLAVACLALAPPAFPGKGGQAKGKGGGSSSPAAAARPKFGLLENFLPAVQAAQGE